MMLWINRSKIDPRYYVIHTSEKIKSAGWRQVSEWLAVVDDFGDLQSVAK